MAKTTPGSSSVENQFDRVAERREPLLRTKMFVPSPRLNLVKRPHLVSRINQGILRPLTLVSAPAGFGKTSLLAEWASGGQPSVAWTSLDPGDNDPYRFLAYLIAAVLGALPGLETGAASMLRSPQSFPIQTILATLINDLTGLPVPFIVVLDDYQFIESPDVNEIVVYLLDHQPPHMHLVIASRSDPLLPLGRLRGRGQLAELRTDDLRFTPPEAAEFLNRVMGLDLDPEHVAALEARTEGWIVGLQMAAIALQSRQSLQGRQDVSDFIASFSGSHRYILEYLGEEVLSRQPEDIRKFLLHTSILERLCGSLCDAVIGQPYQSQEKLERLVKINLFLIPLDEEGRWYRYHHLFADLLRTQLNKFIGDQGVSRLHLRAADWYELNGLVFEAINHASIASDFEKVEHLIEQNYMDMVNRGEFTSLRYWTGKLSKELIYRRPRLCIYEALSCSWFGQLHEADRLLTEAEKRLRSPVSTPDARAMLGHLSYVQSRVTAMRGDTPRAIELCHLARELSPASNLALHLGIGITLGYEYFLDGDFVSSAHTLTETIRSGQMANAINNTVGAYCVLARLYAIQGQLRASYELFQKAEQFIHSAGGQHLGAVGVVEVGMADVLCEWNDLESALVRMQQGLDRIPLWGKADDLALAYTTLARIHLALGDEMAAQQVIEQATRLIRTCGVFSEARNAVETAQVKLWLAQGDWSAAGHWVASHEKGFSEQELFRFENELVHITRARVYIAQNRMDQALGLISRLEETARSGGRKGRLVEILLLKALAFQGMSEAVPADLALLDSLTLAEPEGYLRIFLDEGAALRSLVQEFRNRHGQPAPDSRKETDESLMAYIAKLLAAFSISHPSPSAAIKDLPPSMVEPLSPREQEILGLICQGYSNQDIAEKLVISMNTVKRHNNSLFGKLGVTNRAQAIVLAHQLGLVKDAPT
jgi:LuxR family maltose regulon positive regulatory protein